MPNVEGFSLAPGVLFCGLIRMLRGTRAGKSHGGDGFLEDPGFGERGVQADLEGHAPLPVPIGQNRPVRHDDGGLMDQFESAFGSADRFDWEGPESSRTVHVKADIQPLPMIDQIEREGVFQVEERAELSQMIPGRIPEITIVLARGHSREVHFNRQVKRLLLRESFKQIGQFEEGLIGSECHALGESHRMSIDESLACELDLHAIRAAKDFGIVG